MKGRKKGDVGEAECGEEGMLNEDSRLGRELAGLEGKRGWKRGKWGGKERGEKWGWSQRGQTEENKLAKRRAKQAAARM